MLIFGIIYLFLFEKNIEVKEFLFKLTRGAGHLWFLSMLFWNFIIGFFTVKVNKDYKYQVLLVLILYLVGIISSIIPNIFGISNGLKFSVFFYLGVLLWIHRDKIINICLKKRIIILFIILFISLFLIIELFQPYFSELPLTISKIIVLFLDYSLKTFGVLCFYLIVMYFSNNKNINNIWSVISKKTYGIYVFHQFILKILIMNFQIHIYVNYKIAPIIFFMLTITLSILSTNIFLKTRVGKLLIG